MAKSTSTLNNSLAYGFSQNIVRPVMIKTLKDNIPNAKVAAAVSNSDKFKPIAINLKIGKKVENISVVIYYNGDTIALSMYNMMYAKNVAFIANGKLYIVNGDKLRSNWSNIMTRVRNYVDGSKVSTEMTYADINKVISLAHLVFDVNGEDLDKMNTKAIEYKIAC